MNGNNITEQQAQKEREKFVTAFNDTMIKIWQEQITLLGVIDTGALLASPKAIAMRADGRFFEVSLSQAFLEYGLWQDYGTGRETPCKSSAERELAHTSAEAQPGSRLRHPRGTAATSAERTDGAARAEASLLALCRVATEEDGVNVVNAASGSAESITLR